MKRVVLALLFVLTMPASGICVEKQIIQTGDFTNPKGVANFSETELIVADGQTGEIRLVDKDDVGSTRVLFTVTRGKPTTVFKMKRNILVGNATRHTVDVYRKSPLSQKFTYVRSFLTPVGSASDIAVTDGNVYVVDSEQKNIKVFRSSGRLLDVIEHSGMARPGNIAIANNVIYVSDNGESKLGKTPAVLMFRRQKKSRVRGVLRRLRYRVDHEYAGRLEGETFGFARPRGLAVAGTTLQISETLACRIIQIDLTEMKRLENLAEFGHLEGQLISPKDIYFDSGRGKLYVVNHRARRIEALKAR